MIIRFMAAAVLLAFPLYGAEPFRIAFGSCLHQGRDQPIWDAVNAREPDIFLFIGDNIYADTTDPANMQLKYDMLGNQPGYRKLTSRAKVFATWDDHDYGENDAGRDYVMKDPSKDMFMSFFNIPADSPIRGREGIYQAERLSAAGLDVQIILLDTRWFRDPLTRLEDRVPGKGRYGSVTDTNLTLLGEDQWAWLEEQLREPADLRILASSIQVIPRDHNWECWINMPHERDRLFNLIGKTGANGMVILSGDRHLGEISVLDEGVPYPITEITSSGMNMALGGSNGRYIEEYNRYRAGPLTTANNFGLLTIRPGADPVVHVDLINERNRPEQTYDIPLFGLK